MAALGQQPESRPRSCSCEMVRQTSNILRQAPGTTRDRLFGLGYGPVPSPPALPRQPVTSTRPSSPREWSGEPRDRAMRNILREAPGNTREVLFGNPVQVSLSTSPARSSRVSISRERPEETEGRGMTNVVHEPPGSTRQRLFSAELTSPRHIPRPAFVPPQRWAELESRALRRTRSASNFETTDKPSGGDCVAAADQMVKELQAQVENLRQENARLSSVPSEQTASPRRSSPSPRRSVPRAMPSVAASVGGGVPVVAPWATWMQEPACVVDAAQPRFNDQGSAASRSPVRAPSVVSAGDHGYVQSPVHAPSVHSAGDHGSGALPEAEVAPRFGLQLPVFPRARNAKSGSWDADSNTSATTAASTPAHSCKSAGRKHFPAPRGSSPNFSGNPLRKKKMFHRNASSEDWMPNPCAVLAATQALPESPRHKESKDDDSCLSPPASSAFSMLGSISMPRGRIRFSSDESYESHSDGNHEARGDVAYISHKVLARTVDSSSPPRWTMSRSMPDLVAGKDVIVPTAGVPTTPRCPASPVAASPPISPRGSATPRQSTSPKGFVSKSASAFFREQGMRRPGEVLTGIRTVPLTMKAPSPPRTLRMGAGRATGRSRTRGEAVRSLSRPK